MKARRRGFLKAVAAAPAALMAPAAAATQAPATAPPADPVAEALAESLRREFGQHLDADELGEVRREIERNRAAAARLRAALPLDNADDPVGRFEARPPLGRAASSRP